MREIDVFGKLITEDLRDAAFNHYLDIKQGFCSGDGADMAQELATFSDQQKAFIGRLVTQCVDMGVYEFLFAFEKTNHDVAVHVKGKNILDQSDGLQGEIFSSDGWFEKFSQHKEEGLV